MNEEQENKVSITYYFYAWETSIKLGVQSKGYGSWWNNTPTNGEELATIIGRIVDYVKKEQKRNDIILTAFNPVLTTFEDKKS